MLSRFPIAATLLALLLSGCSGGAETAKTGDAGDPAAASLPVGALPLEVTRVLDGDSLEAVLRGEQVEIRLLGVNAPERGECWSDEARAALDDLLASGPAAIDIWDTDQFGRILGYVYVPGAFVNLMLLDEGQAVAVDTDHPALGVFLESEDTAFGRRAGLWSPDACGPPTPFLVGVRRVEFDPPGPDGADLNGEWVSLLNFGGEAHLGGWTLRDESSSHRYHFPTGTRLPAGKQLTVRTGCGDDGADEVFWCADGPVWSNEGDTVILHDDVGNVVDRYRYEGS